MTKQLRDYQLSAVETLFDYFNDSSGNPLIVAPVGAGKSLIIAEIIKRIPKGVKIVMVSHVKELLEQDSAELQEHYPEAYFGFYCAGLGQKELHRDITFASIQSVHNKASCFNKPPQIIIIDESHLISHKDGTQYQSFIRDCKMLNPNVVVIGLTGTPFRADTGRLDKGDNKIFDEIIYEIGIGYMIDNGYLCKPTTPDTNTRFDLSNVQVRGGDYIQGQLEEAVDIDEKTKSCIDEIIEKGRTRNKWLIFTAGIAHCSHVLEELLRRGIQAEMLTGDTPREERSAIIRRYRAGETKCLVNVAVLTTGFNVPEIDMLVFMRPTRSPVLYIQCTGRGLRTVYASGYDLQTTKGRLESIKNSSKKDCLILDFGQIIENLGAIDKVKLNKTYKNMDKEPEEKKIRDFKRCPVCSEICEPTQKYCLNCSYNFIAEIELQEKASKQAIMSTDELPQTVKVYGWNKERGFNAKKENAIPNLKVIYFTSIGEIFQWICYEHPKHNYGYKLAEVWHKKVSSDPMPSNVMEALKCNFNMPTELLVKKEDKFYKVLDLMFNEVKEEEELDIDF